MTTLGIAGILIGVTAFGIGLLIGALSWSARRRGRAEERERQNRLDREVQEAVRDALAEERDGKASDDMHRLRGRRVRDSG